MSNSVVIDLTSMQRDVLRDVFTRYSDRFESVGVYGSRATGKARPGSDVDLVVFGSADDRLVGRLLTELEDSNLSIFADVVEFERIGNPKLRREIERDVKALFTACELKAGDTVRASSDLSDPSRLAA